MKINDRIIIIIKMQVDKGLTETKPYLPLSRHRHKKNNINMANISVLLNGYKK